MHVLLCALLLLAGLATAAPPSFAPVVPGAALRFPADYGAHPDFKTEWWYLTGWLQTADGKPLGFQVTFFRSATTHDRADPSAFAPHNLIIGHAALSDPALGKLQRDQRSAREGFGLAYAKTGDTDLALDDWRMRRLPDGGYEVGIGARSFTLNLKLAATEPLLPQGEAGYSRKGPEAANASYYYSHPQLRVTGAVARAGGRATVVSGTAWLDHEWSSSALAPDAAGWDWVGANLADGSALMAFQIRSRQGGKLWSHATLRDASGKVTQYASEQVSFSANAMWRSPRTRASYPVAATLTTGATQWQLQPLMQDQELDARRTTGAVYWEGAVTIRRDGADAGRAYLEMTGYDRNMTL